MNVRVLELLKKPELFLKEDFPILEKTITNAPYTQSVRALYLYGIKKYTPERYEEELSITAAYTTDKKILYQFINGKIEKPVIIEQNMSMESKIESKEDENITDNENKEVASYTSSSELPKVQVEKEEQISDSSISTIILEKTMEEKPLSKDLLNQDVKEELKEDSSNIKTVEPKIKESVSLKENTISTDDIINEEKILNPKLSLQKPIEIIPEKGKIEVTEPENTSISFHEQSDFMATVQVNKQKKTEEKYTPIQPKLNRHEEEMKKLLAEVEAKMKAKKKKTEIIEEKEQENHNHEISFAETASFEVKKVKKTIESSLEKETKALEKPIENKSWKPMTIPHQTPDAIITKEKPTFKEEPPTEKKLKTQRDNYTTKNIKEERTEEKDATNIPVLNVSFFSPDIKIIPTDNKQKDSKEEKKPIKDSNVPFFINTWQNWLKIDRSEKTQQEKEDKVHLGPSTPSMDKAVEKKTISKDEVIEKFIQEEPKISKLKEDLDFVVKQNKEDISHLMTETLAKIYTEQKLYAKAIKGYKVLINKYPEKEIYFLEKIKEINALKNN